MQDYSIITGFGPPYAGDSNTSITSSNYYLPADVPLGFCYTGSTLIPVGLVLAQGGSLAGPAALSALFGPPPSGLGALPQSVLFDAGEWQFTLMNGYDSFLLNFNGGLFVPGCSYLGSPNQFSFAAISSAAAVPAVASSANSMLKSLAASTGSGSPPSPTSIMQTIQNLSQQVPPMITTDATLSSRLSTDLGVAYQRLVRISQFPQPTTSVLLQLNDAITRLQIHTRMSPPPPDMAAASQALAQIVAAKNILIGACAAGTGGCSVTSGQ